jgi:hypothetical protein
MNRYQLQSFPWDSLEAARLKKLFGEHKQIYLERLAEFQEPVASLEKRMELQLEWLRHVQALAQRPTWH